MSRRVGTTTASSAPRATSNSSSSFESVPMPSRASRARPASSSVPAMPLSLPHRPQASDCAGSPSALRRCASASRKTLAAT